MSRMHGVFRAMALLPALAVITAVGAGHARPPPPAAKSPGNDECAVLAALDFSEAIGAVVKITAAQVAADRALPRRCHVSGRIAPEIGFEVWLPEDAWNGKLLMTGCFKLCGTIRADQMEDALVRGYATVTTDMGHSRAKDSDATWAWNNKSAETDFAYRATHLSALVAKEIAEAYYGNGPERSYFRGCATGGRQALVEAQRYPEDFDGIIAGAPFNPAFAVPHMFWVDRANAAADGRPILGKAQFALLHRAALAACDGDDGVTDGVIGDPESCDFKPASLLCAEKASQDCLTADQVEAAAKIYQGAVNGRGERLYPFGATVGSESGWEDKLIGRDGRPSVFHAVTQTWSQYLAYDPDPPQDSGPFTFDFDRDPARLAPMVDLIGYKPALDGFRARDGKLIIYHGWADESLLPSHTLDYWRKLERVLGSDAVASFARLYMLPGVMNCGGGPGAGAGAGDVDLLTALEQWVEHDQAPERLVAFKIKANVPAPERQPRFPVPPAEVSFSRAVYPYPRVARYSGKGDTNDAGSFESSSRAPPSNNVAPAPPEPAGARPAVSP